MKSLMKDFGATDSDLNLMESGHVHDRLPKVYTVISIVNNDNFYGDDNTDDIKDNYHEIMIMMMMIMRMMIIDE